MNHFQQILKTTGILTVSPSDTISSALAQLTSSHDAAFVFDENKKFIGVINPYHCLIKSSSPGKTKVENCLFHQPKVTSKDSIERIARLMIESKIHYLPVFDDKNEFVGITSGRRILHLMQDMDIASKKLTEVLSGKNGNVLSVQLDDSLGLAMNLFKEHKVSKLMVVDANMKLKGILSYYDLIPYLVAPGVSKSKGRGVKASDDKEKLMSMKVKNYAKTTILTLTPQDRVIDVIHEILKKKKGSVVVVDTESHPLGILTTKDLFALLDTQVAPSVVELVKKNLEPQYEKIIEDLVKFIDGHISRGKAYKKAKLLVDVERDGAIYNMHLYLDPGKGELEVVKKEGKDLADVIHDIKKALKTLETKV